MKIKDITGKLDEYIKRIETAKSPEDITSIVNEAIIYYTAIMDTIDKNDPNFSLLESYNIMLLRAIVNKIVRDNPALSSLMGYIEILVVVLWSRITEEIKKLQDRIKSLNERFEKLEKEVNDLKNEINFKKDYK